MVASPIVTVLEPASSLALVDLATVKDELGIADNNASQDARLSRYIAQASAQIHAYCRRVFPIQAYRNVFVADWWHRHQTGALILSERPVTEILGITDQALLDIGQYEPNLRSGMIWRLSPGLLRCGWYGQEVIVDFRAGYDPIPADVQAAALRVVVLQKSVQGRDPYLKVREAPTYGREEFWIGNMPLLDGGLPQDVAQSLADYVNPSFA
jgi:hypothetical protein